MALTENEKREFREKGVLALRSRVAKPDLASVKRLVLDELERLGLKANGKLVSSKIQDLPVFQQTGKLGQMLKVGSELDCLFHEDLLANIGSLATLKVKRPIPPPQLLLSFPHKKAWSLAQLNWHLDLSIPANDEVPGIQAFVLIDDVQPKGGATLALAGSHRLPYLRNGPGGNSHAVLRGHPKFAELYGGSVAAPERFFTPESVDGIEVYIVEMSGRAGDVFLMDMRVLHAPSINATKSLRMMATSRFIK